MPQWMVTANRLSDGRVVYLDADRRWVEHDAQGWVGDDEAAADAHVEWAKTQTEIVVEPYRIEVRADAAGIQHASARERIRALGPDGVLGRFGYLRASAAARAAVG